eukprot:12126998-Alexandrium_andersonii.AAC.1
MSASLVGSEMCIRDRGLQGTCGQPSGVYERARTRACVLLWKRGGRGGCCCLLYTSDAADDM